MHKIGGLRPIGCHAFEIPINFGKYTIILVVPTPRNFRAEKQQKHNIRAESDRKRQKRQAVIKKVVPLQRG